MIPRRIAEHVKTHNWFAVAIDLVIVVLGVFIGLQVQEWSRNLDNRRQEARIIEGLLSDLEIDRAQFESGEIAGLRRLGAANASLVGAGLAPLAYDALPALPGTTDYSFDLSNPANLTPANPNRLWTHVVIGYYPTLSTLTYDQIAGAGNIKVIRDPAIVREIQLYYNISAAVDAQNEKLLAIREALLATGADYGLAPFADLAPEEYRRLVAAEPRLAASIRNMATFTIFHYAEIAAAKARAIELEARLKAYQEKGN